MSLETIAALLTIEFQEMYVRRGQRLPRTGLHASSLLVADSEWCVRQHVLIRLYPDQMKAPDLQPWDWRREAIFANGWSLHERWQKLFRDRGFVVYSPEASPVDGIVAAVFGKEMVKQVPETDLTHYDETREVFFSPDAIISWAGIRYVVEIKGLDTGKFQALTDDLLTAIQVSDVVAKARVQCNLYMHLLNVKRGVLLIEDKNSQLFKLWVIEYDKALAKPYVERMYQVKGATITTKTVGLPKRVCASRNDKLAKSCPMRDVCFSKEIGE